MKATEVLKMGLETSENMVLSLIEDMRDAPLTFPTPDGGNHPLWVLGHLTYSEGGLVHGMMQGKPNPVAQWKDLFNGGTEPVANADHYPSLDELLAKFKELRAGTLKLLDSLSDADLDTPCKEFPPEWESVFGTYGKCLLMLSQHDMHHRGQIADARRVLKRDPIMA